MTEKYRGPQAAACAPIGPDVAAMTAELVGKNKDVLVHTPADSGLIAMLSASGCRVTAVVRDEATAQQCSAHSVTVRVSEVGEANLATAIGDERFDVVVPDILAHIGDPRSLLRSARPLLRLGGYIVVAVPNVAHGDARIALLNGRFPGESLGVSPSPLFPFFTLETLAAVLADAGFGITYLARQERDLSSLREPGDLTLPDPLLEAIRAAPEAGTTAFIVAAHPVPRSAHVLIRTLIDDPPDERVAARENAQTEGVDTDRPTVSASLRDTLARQITALRAMAGGFTGSRPTSRQAARGLSPDEYRHLIHEIRSAVQEVVPGDATVVVISKGDANLLELGARHAWHFPRTEDGTYAGHHPADSAEAISRLEALRAVGAGYLVIPATSLWWLDHYADFRRHIERHYRALMRHDETCVIFALREGRGLDHIDGSYND